MSADHLGRCRSIKNVARPLNARSAPTRSSSVASALPARPTSTSAWARTRTRSRAFLSLDSGRRCALLWPTSKPQTIILTSSPSFLLRHVISKQVFSPLISAFDRALTVASFHPVSSQGPQVRKGTWSPCVARLQGLKEDWTPLPHTLSKLCEIHVSCLLIPGVLLSPMLAVNSGIGSRSEGRARPGQARPGQGKFKEHPGRSGCSSSVRALQ